MQKKDGLNHAQKARLGRRLALCVLMTAAWLPAGMSLVGEPSFVVRGACLLAVPFVLAAALAWVGPSRSRAAIQVRGRQQKRLVVVAVLLHLGLIAVTQWPLQLVLRLSAPALNPVANRMEARDKAHAALLMGLYANARCGNAKQSILEEIAQYKEVNVEQVGFLTVEQMQRNRSCAGDYTKVRLTSGRTLTRVGDVWYTEL